MGDEELEEGSISCRVGIIKQNWMTEDEVKHKLGVKAVEVLKYMEKIKFVESQWSNTPASSVGSRMFICMLV